jgi:hypothetical protein
MLQARALWLETHPRPTDLHQLSTEVEVSPAVVKTERMKVQSSGPADVGPVSRKRNSAKEKTPHGVVSRTHS